MIKTEGIVKTIDAPVDEIKPSPFQPRLTFNLEDIRGSIQRDGILVPLTVREKEGYYELVDGERRLRLAKELGYVTVPVTVINVDDDTARRMVWKVNTLRQEYTSKEKAFYFKKLQEEYGMSLRGIARECDYAEDSVVAHLNVLKLPEKYQNLVWDGPLSVSHIQELRPFFNQGAMRIAHITGLLEQAIERKLTRSELREVVRPELREIEDRRIEAAQEMIKEISPVPQEIKLETSAELEEVARVLRKRAKELKTPEQIHHENIEKARKALNKISLVEAERLGITIKIYLEKINEIESYLEERPLDALNDIRELNKELKSEIKEIKKELEEKERQQREIEIQKRIEDEAKRRAREIEEAEKKQIEEEIRRKTRSEILAQPELLQEVVSAREKEFDELRDRAREASKGVSEVIGEALLKADLDIQKAKESEDRILMQNYLMIGSILKSLENGTIFCIEHPDESQKLVWSCGISLSETHKKLREKLGL